MPKKEINLRVRLIIIKKGKILLSYTNDEKFYFYIGGKVEYGETIIQASQREIKEECGANFSFKKILYIRDYINPEQREHSLELYVLGDIDRFNEIEGVKDGEFGGTHWQTWIELDKLKDLDVKPKGLTKQLLSDYRKGFVGGAIYLGEIG